MSAMSELHIDIVNLLEMGVHPVAIASQLKIPLSMVYDVNETREEEYSPFKTVNS